jgi:hypothetical protein
VLINVREYRGDNQKRTIQRNWQYRVHKTKAKQSKNRTQANTNDVNKTRSLPQTTGCKDEPNMVYMRVFVSFMTYYWGLTRVNRRMPLVKQELLTRSTPVHSRSLVWFVLLNLTLYLQWFVDHDCSFVLFSSWPLCCLSFLIYGF